MPLSFSTLSNNMYVTNILTYFRRVCGILTEFMIFCGVMTLLILSRSFSSVLNIMRRSNTNVSGSYCERMSQIRLVFLQYKELKMFSLLLNNLVGHSITCFLGMTCIYFATNLNEVFTGGGRIGLQYYSKVVRWLFYNLHYGFTLILSASVCEKVSRFSCNINTNIFCTAIIFLKLWKLKRL